MITVREIMESDVRLNPQTARCNECSHSTGPGAVEITVASMVTILCWRCKTKLRDALTDK